MQSGGTLRSVTERQHINTTEDNTMTDYNYNLDNYDVDEDHWWHDLDFTEED